jgi:hypothetical protein
VAFQVHHALSLFHQLQQQQQQAQQSQSMISDNNKSNLWEPNREDNPQVPDRHGDSPAVADTDIGLAALFRHQASSR